MQDKSPKMKYYIVYAFTDKPFGGNPAGVALLDGEIFPDDSLMLQIAAELRYSETAFGGGHAHSPRRHDLCGRHRGGGGGGGASATYMTPPSTTA